jgi:glycosyltransferase involved in cell wall biosynthesis
MSVPRDLGWELLVVDNNSSDNTRQEVDAFAEHSGLNIRYILEPRTGKSFALNTGIKEANGEIIAFTDDDVLVAPDWLTELAETFKQFDCMGVGGRSIALWNGLARPNWLVTEGPYGLSSGPIPALDLEDEAKETRQAPCGLNMAFRKSAFEQYGLFRIDLGIFGAERIGGEDTEFGRRLILAGEKIVYSSRAVIFHPVDQKRITRNYFLSFYLNMGRAGIREEGWPSGAVLWCGVPRYMFRVLLMKCVRWLTAFGTAKRFCCKARVYFILGQIAEARALLNKGKEDHADFGGAVRPAGTQPDRASTRSGR